mmetsp:Transcript_8668/g.18652  ORF Transcript_8668/g.18652 Transcript_8668/m.18652 type:complete len:210 (+) Transcript_8668:627-1256(+)
MPRLLGGIERPVRVRGGHDQEAGGRLRGSYLRLRRLLTQGSAGIERPISQVGAEAVVRGGAGGQQRRIWAEGGGRRQALRTARQETSGGDVQDPPGDRGRAGTRRAADRRVQDRLRGMRVGDVQGLDRRRRRRAADTGGGPLGAGGGAAVLRGRATGGVRNVSQGDEHSVVPASLGFVDGAQPVRGVRVPEAGQAVRRPRLIGLGGLGL